MPGSIPNPSLTLTITPPGGSPTNYSGNLTYNGSVQQATITQNFGRQGDTAVLPLVDDWGGRTTPNFYIPVLSRVSLVDNVASQNIFAGVVNDPGLIVTSPTRNEWKLSCTDYTFYANNVLVFGTFNGYTIDQIMIALTEQANCGISAASTANGGFVSPAPSINTVTFNYTTLTKAWQVLAQLASQSAPYGWYVDQNLALHFINPATALNSGVTITTSPTTGGSTTEAHLIPDTTFLYEWDGTSIHNQILVQGATQTITQNPAVILSPTDQWTSDGVQSAWPLRYLFSSAEQLLIGGVQTSTEAITPGEAQQTNAAWTIQQNANGQYFLITSSVPSAGTSIEFWYDYSQNIIAQASDAQSQTLYNGPNRGIYAEYINDTTLTNFQMALARALRERTEYAFAAERVTLNTSWDFMGYIRAGYLFQFVNRFVPDSQNSYSWGINDTFICTANTITIGGGGVGGYRQMKMTAVRI
jgi:hypothetical protein